MVNNEKLERIKTNITWQAKWNENLIMGIEQSDGDIVSMLKTHLFITAW